MKTKIWIARNGDGSLFAFKNEPHRLLKDDTGINIWYDHLHSFKMDITKEYNWKYKNLKYEDNPVINYVTENEHGNIVLID